MSGCTAAIRAVLVIWLLSVLAAGCRFPDTCDLYPVPDGQAAAEAASWDPRTSCSLSVRYLGRTYTPQDGAIVTDVGDPLDGAKLRACDDVNTSNDQSRSAGSRPVAAFAFGTYCTDDVIAVELTQGEQLRLFQANE